ALAALARDHAAISAFPLDVTDPGAVEEAAARIEADLGPIDLAILNAGIGTPLYAKHFDAAAVRKVFETNYMGVVHGLSALLPRMTGRGRGHIALMASVAGYRGLRRMGAYAPSKAALISLAECLKPELDEAGIAISVINPGFIDTPMTKGNTAPMPFILQADAAARRVLYGLEKRKFEVAFPWPLVAMLKILRLLPYPLYFRWQRRGFSRGKQ
ncbi:MAG: SDR family NAD(P)-dependent oxidoreductase, partial [Rhodomicrobium sp.]|nr:SDR family NAD(P)-dependent oxidoreductase [Rhodomicrobium sp.]